MKAIEFAVGLRALLDVGEIFGGDKAANSLRAFLPLFETPGTVTVAALKKKTLTIKADDRHPPQLKDLMPVLNAYRQLMAKTSKAFLKDVDTVIEMVEFHGEASIEAFAEVALNKLAEACPEPAVVILPDPALVESYVHAVEENYKDPLKFEKVYGELKARGRVPEPVVRLVASRFSTTITPSTSKSEALKRIKKLHTDYIRQTRKQKVTRAA